MMACLLYSLQSSNPASTDSYITYEYTNTGIWQLLNVFTLPVLKGVLILSHILLGIFIGLFLVISTLLLVANTLHSIHVSIHCFCMCHSSRSWLYFAAYDVPHVWAYCWLLKQLLGRQITLVIHLVMTQSIFYDYPGDTSKYTYW